MSDRVAVMSAGRILQVGSPREIYDHPAERFVADFIGETNFLTAEVRSADGAGGMLVALPEGREIQASVAEGVEVAPGRQVTVVVRPEHTELVAPAEDPDLTGTVERVVFFGTDTHYHVALASGGEFTLRLQNRRDAGPVAPAGSAVGIRIEPGAVQVLRD